MFLGENMTFLLKVQIMLNKLVVGCYYMQLENYLIYVKLFGDRLLDWKVTKSEN